MKFRLRVIKPAALEPGFLDAALRESLPRIVRLVESKARENLGGGVVAVRSGKTLAGLRSRIDVAGPNPRGEVGVRGRRGHIARLLETGAAPHDIVARNGRLLTFHVGSKVISRRHVRHPGIRARRWLTLAGEASIPDAERELQASVERSVSQAVARPPVRTTHG